jgi:flagellar assembly factor FliW
MTTGLALSMKTLATKAFGTIEIAPASVFAFPEGLYGFPDDREYA